MDDKHAGANDTQVIEIKRGRGPVRILVWSVLLGAAGYWLLVTPEAATAGPTMHGRGAGLDALVQRWPWVLIVVSFLLLVPTGASVVLWLWRFVRRDDVAVRIDARGVCVNVMPWQSCRIEWDEVVGVRLMGEGRQAALEIEANSGRKVRFAAAWLDCDPEELLDQIEAAWRPGVTRLMRGGSGRAS